MGKKILHCMFLVTVMIAVSKGSVLADTVTFSPETSGALVIQDPVPPSSIEIEERFAPPGWYIKICVDGFCVELRYHRSDGRTVISVPGYPGMVLRCDEDGNCTIKTGGTELCTITSDDEGRSIVECDIPFIGKMKYIIEPVEGGGICLWQGEERLLQCFDDDLLRTINPDLPDIIREIFPWLPLPEPDEESMRN